MNFEQNGVENIYKIYHIFAPLVEYLRKIYKLLESFLTLKLPENR